MPSEIVDQRQMSSFCLSSPRSSFFSEEIAIPAQRQIGFWRSETAPDHPGTEGISLNLGGQDFPSSPLGKHPPMGTNIVESLDPLQSCFLKEQHNSFRLEPLSMELRSPARISATNHKGADQQYALLSKQPVESSLLFMEGKIDPNGLRPESGLFSSSLSAVFNNKFRLSSNEVSFGQSIDAARISFEEDEPLESLEELEAQTIGDLLPDDDDLLSVAISDPDYQPRPISGDDVEDDLFCSGGGLELEADDNFSCFRAPKMIGGGMINVQNGGLNCPVVGEHVFGGCPSRTLIARNINDNVEDAELRALFEQYGDIHTLYTASKHHGFLMVTYYDIRAAQNAIRALQNKPWRHQKLDIHFSIQKGNPLEEEMDQGMVLVDSSIPNDNLKLMFGVYGEIKEIHEAPHRQFHKLIEFYDLRAAEAALHALNNTDTGAKIIKLKPSCPGGASFMRHFSPRVEHEELSRFRLQIPSNNSPPVCSGSIPFGAITSTSLDNGAIQGLHSGAQGPFDQFMEPELNRICSSVPHVASAPVRIPSADNHGNQCGPAEATHSFGLASLGVQGMQPFHAHSLPEFDDGKINGVPRNSLSTVPAMGIHGNSRPVDVVENRRFHTVGSGGLSSHSFEQNEAFGVFASGSCPIHGHGFVWNNADSYHNRPSGPMMWSSPTAYMNNNMSAHPLHGFPRTPSHVPNTVLLLHHHHVGSAPAVNPSLWERRHMYAGDPIEPSAFHPGSLGSIGFSGGPPMHPVELAHHIFPHAGGNCTDHPMSPMHIGIPSPQQRCHMFHGRGPMVPIPATFDVPSDRIRSRRNDANISQADLKKQYELDIDRILRGEDSRTTLMIKNIPNKYTSKMLLATIDEHHRGTYDFIYLPIDFKNKCNVGYAFINLTDPKHIIPFFKTFNGKKWEKFNSEKVASLAYARIQGKAALIAHFQNSSLMNEDKRCRPILFHSDGPNAGDQEPFPMGDNVRSRPGRSRTADHEHLEGSPSSSPTRERSSPNVTDQPTTTQ